MEQFASFVDEWKLVVRSEEVEVSERPVAPTADWYRDEDDAHVINIEMPNAADVSHAVDQFEASGFRGVKCTVGNSRDALVVIGCLVM